jgi:hypothetical protein
MPSAPLYTYFFCQLADPLRFEDPPPGFLVAERSRRWLDMLAATACFIGSMCPAHSPATPPQLPAQTCSTPCTTDTAATLDSMDGPPASVAFVLMSSPLSRFLGPAFPCSPQVSGVSGAPDQVSDDEVPIPHLPVTAPPQPSARAAATSLAEHDDEVPVPRCSCRIALLLCCGDAAVPLTRLSVSCLSSSTSPVIVHHQAAPQAGGRDGRPLGYA